MDTPYPSHVLNLVYATDKGYLFISAVSAASAARLASAPERLVIHLLDCGLDDADWERFCTLVRKGDSRVILRRHVIDTEGYKKLVGYRKSLAVYARMRIPDLLPDVQWCVYADGDTLFTDDPFKLIQFFDSTYAVLGWEVFNNQSPTEQNNAGFLRDWYAEHCPDYKEVCYICTGFLLINLDLWRKRDIPTQCLAFIERHSPPWPVDLSTNYVCREMKGALPPEWGIFSSLTSLIQKPRLVHYCLEVPNKTKFNRSYGFRDITAVWMYFVRWTLGLSVTEACGVPLWKWILGRLYCHLLRAKLALLLCLPRFHTLAREKQYSMTFLHGDQRRLLSRQFWMTR